MCPIGQHVYHVTKPCRVLDWDIARLMRYFVYCRKSTESEDRQILSIDSQNEELHRTFGNRPDVQIVEVFKESFTAKAPGRPLFNHMLERLEHGDAEGIIAWHPDRLARNSVDGGRIVYLLDKGVLKDLKFSTFSFENNSQGKFMLSIIFGYSKYYVDSLSENVKRGIRAKLERGWLPNKPPTGYKNEAEHRTIVPDPERFPVLRKLFEAAGTGAYTVAALERMMREEWGFRTPKRKRSGGRPLSVASVYRILSNPFYAGYITWKGQLYPGKHEPMIGWSKFEHLQRMLGRPGTQRPQKHSFPYTGLIRCGACGLMVTAENKVNRYGSQYTYYHCTRRNVGPRCRQPSLEARELERQIVEALQAVSVPDEAISRARAIIEQKRDDLSDMELQRNSLTKALKGSDEQLRTLLDLRLRGLIDDQELVSRREDISREKAGLKEQLSALDQRSTWFEPASTAISFGNRAAAWFMAGDGQTRRVILRTISSNLYLVDGRLNIQAAFPYSIGARSDEFLDVCGLVNDVRTRWLRQDKQLLDLIEGIKKIEQMRSASLEKVV